ncbi:MAG: RuvA C-terminal domain-containing protein, partial [bacterium]
YKIDRELDLKQIETSSMQSNDYFRLEALNALMNLGYMRNEAEKIIREVLKMNESVNLSTEEIIRKSLEYISK